ncbi:MAG: LTA synthase family protein [Bacteroidia bacterium]|nr:LTA synthase family protein [Bacteroidia bacterium]NNC85631.1 LTA synthase family protein [Bacteroidia bacterium]NNM15027.1 LTA synthase family protein [Bacteroidia bacterium]
MPNAIYHATLLLKRLAVVLLFYTICRLGFYFFNLNYFSSLSFFEVVKHFFFGIRFDLSAIAFTNAAFIILSILPFQFVHTKPFQKILLFLFMIVNSLAIVMNMVDWAYFPFTLRRTSVEVLSLFALGDDMVNVLPTIVLDYWYLVFIAIALCYLLYKLYSYISIETKCNKKYVVNLLTIFFVIICTGILARGGFQYKPIKALAAAQYTNAKHAPLILNTPFTIVTNTSKRVIDNRFADIDLEDYSNSNFKYGKNFSSDSALTGSNVVIFILESFSSEYIGYLNNGKGYTPFLDSILAESWVFPNAFANGKKSIDALPAIISSLPGLMDDPFISSNYNSNAVPSLSNYLKKEKYYTSFYHGGNNGTMGFDAYTSLCGFDHYYGREEYEGNKEDYDGQWGIYDEPYLKYFEKELTKQKQPFLSCFFSLSSHHPFKLPKKYKNAFQEGELPIHPCISYTDAALKQFFQNAKNQDWFKNTLFVFTADHTGPTTNQKELSNHNLYSVPIAYYYPGKIEPKKDERITQHIDIMPTVLDLIDYTDSIASFGESQLYNHANNFAISYANNIYQCIFKDEVLEYDGTNYLTPSKNSENSNLNEAIIANYNYRMINNKLLNE